jgi:hypothetical protein
MGAQGLECSEVVSFLILPSAGYIINITKRELNWNTNWWLTQVLFQVLHHTEREGERERDVSTISGQS